MRTIALLFLAAMAAIYITVHAVSPWALQRETGARPSDADLSHPPNSIGSTAFIVAPHIPHDAKAADAH